MIADFYDALAPYYHLIYGDWEAAITRQGAALASLLEIAGVGKDDPILDAASGIGTQTLGLLKLGYQVTASDISAGAIARLHAELASRGLVANTYVDDLRTLARTAAGSMAAIIACDNSVPHLLSDSEILQALRSCLRCLRPGGTALFSVRDYARIVRKNPDVRPYDLQYDGNTRFLASPGLGVARRSIRHAHVPHFRVAGWILRYKSPGLSLLRSLRRAPPGPDGRSWLCGDEAALTTCSFSRCFPVVARVRPDGIERASAPDHRTKEYHEGLACVS